MTTDPSLLGDKLAQFAEDLIAEVEGAPIETRVTAFKALSAFYISRSKLGKVVPDDEETGGLVAARERMRALAEGDE